MRQAFVTIHLVASWSLLSLVATGQDKLFKLTPFCGSWTYEAKEIRPDGSTTMEFGTMEASWYLDSTYLRLEAQLSGEGNTRYYSQFIGYDRSTKQYTSVYLYSGTVQKVFETGTFEEANNSLVIEGLNPFSQVEENGINIRSTFKISEERLVLEVMELRPTGEWELGYLGTFKRQEE